MPNAYGNYLEPLGFTKSDNQPDPMRVRWVHPENGTRIDVLERRKYLGLGLSDIRHEWVLTPPDGASLFGPINGRGHVRLLGALALLDLSVEQLERFVAHVRAEIPKYAAGDRES
jgi:hypothetical protein